MKALMLAAIVPLVTTGCYVPPLGSQIERDDFARLRTGEDARASVESQLHHPDVFFETSGWVVAGKSRDRGMLVVPAAAQGGGGLVGLGTARSYRIFLRFDDRGMLARLDVESSRREETPLPGQGPLPVDASPAESLVVDPAERGERPRFTCVAADSAGSLAAGADRGRVWLWSGSPGAGPTRLVVREPEGSSKDGWRPGKLDRLAFADHGRGLVCLGKNGDLAIVALPRQAPGFAGAMLPLAPSWARRRVVGFDVSADGARIAVLDRAGRVDVLDGIDGQVARTCRPPEGWDTRRMALSPDGRLLAVVETRRGLIRLRLRDLVGARPDVVGDSAECLPESNFDLQGVRFSPDGRRLAVDLLTHVQVWGVEDPGVATGRPPRLVQVILRPFAGSDLFLRGGVNPGRAPVFLAGSDLALAADRLYVYTLNDSTTRPLCLLRSSAGQGPVTDFAAIPGTRRVAGTTRRGVFVWQAPVGIPE